MLKTGRLIALWAAARPFVYPDGVTVTGDNGSASSRTLIVTYEVAQALDKAGDTVLTPYIPAPMTGAVGTDYFSGPQYSGTVTWGPANTFAVGTAYMAAVTMTPNPGYTFTGVADNAFTHTGASFVVYASGSNVVTDNAAPLAIALPDGLEAVPAGFTLTARDDQSRGGGHHRERPDPGASNRQYRLNHKSISVGAGVTLTLQNITLV
jgi:hypothetical protein